MREPGLGSKNDVHLGGAVEPLKTAPENLSSWGSIGLASQVAADSSHHGRRLTECRRLLGWDRVFGDVNTQSLPLFIFEEERARRVGRLAAEHRQVKDPPSDYHIDAQTSLQMIGGG